MKRNYPFVSAVFATILGMTVMASAVANSNPTGTGNVVGYGSSSQQDKAVKAVLDNIDSLLEFVYAEYMSNPKRSLLGLNKRISQYDHGAHEWSDGSARICKLVKNRENGFDIIDALKNDDTMRCLVTPDIYRASLEGRDAYAKLNVDMSLEMAEFFDIVYDEADPVGCSVEGHYVWRLPDQNYFTTFIKSYDERYGAFKRLSFMQSVQLRPCSQQ